MQGVDKIVVRRKGGPSKARIKNDREFKVTRLNNSEFQGRARGVHWIMGALYPVRRVADHNLCGAINRSMKHVQNRDGESALGQRNIILSKYGSVLDGFSMNRFSVFESLVRTPLKYTMAKDALTAVVSIPELIAEMNFFPPEKHSLFSVMAQLSVVPDLFGRIMDTTLPIRSMDHGTPQQPQHGCTRQKPPLPPHWI